ncbi:ABC transporter permease [Spongiimicrobium salis]|uniref:ABC transporter permease n=1 Tax=Spongiimicrobium salis TaxID=1667022 RepID=UPI00374D4F94
MLRHNLLIIYRNFKRYKSSFFINLIGLSTGLACSLFIILWVTDELKVDKFHNNDEQLYQVMEKRDIGGEIVVSHRTSGPSAETIVEELPEIEIASPVMHYSWFPKFALTTNGKDKIKATGQFVGEDYFKIFSYDLIEGNVNTAIKDRNSVAISQSLAKKLFGSDTNVVGKAIEVLNDFDGTYTVTGVFKDVPANSSEQFDFVFSFEKFKEIVPSVLQWGNNGTRAYVLLNKNADVDKVNKKIEGFIDSKIENTNRTIFLKQYSRNYLYGSYEDGIQKGGRIEYVRLFSIIALFILLMACINFMNLSTAKALRRVKEVGIKKAIGAYRSNLILQYLGESMVITVISLIFALLIVLLLLPQFNIITGKALSISIDTTFLIMLLGITGVTGLIAGSYPAFYLSGFNPEIVLKGKINKSVGEAWVRKILVVVQFALSVILIVAVIVVYLQIDLVQTADMGYDRDNVLYFEKEGMSREQPESYLAELQNIPEVISASSMSNSIVGSHNQTGGLDWEGRNPDEVIVFEIVDVDYGLIELLEMEVLEGRAFSKNFGSDDTKIIFNEAAIAQMRISEPIGKSVNLWGEERQIIGVVKDFHFESLYNEVKPLFLKINPGSASTIMVRTKKGDEKKAIQNIQDLNRRINPGYVVDYEFLDKAYQAQYKAEERVSILSRYFAILAIVISCLGLFGLAAFTAERRIKEIGIRKVLGANNTGIIYLLSTDFTKMVLISIAIGLPLSYFLMRSWLLDFAYRIGLDWWIFVIAAILALIIAWITVSIQAYRASVKDPVDCLAADD